MNGQVKQNVYTNSISALKNNKDPRRREWESSHIYNNKEDNFLPIETVAEPRILSWGGRTIVSR